MNDKTKGCIVRIPSWKHRWADHYRHYFHELTLGLSRSCCLFCRPRNLIRKCIESRGEMCLLSLSLSLSLPLLGQLLIVTPHTRFIFRSLLWGTWETDPKEVFFLFVCFFVCLFVFTWFKYLVTSGLGSLTHSFQ